MKFLQFFISSLLIIFLISCSKDVKKQSILKEESLDLQMIEAYKDGLSSLEEEMFFLLKKFNEAEILYPQSIWAPRSTH